MISTFKFFIRHFLFWLLFFVAFRLLFILSQPSTGEISPGEYLLTLFAGYRLDISTASYLAVIPFFITLLYAFGSDRLYPQILNIYYSIIILIAVVFSISNIVIYQYGGTLLNSRALEYVLQPVEMLASVTTM